MTMSLIPTWLADNYTWVFSGVGVAVLVGIIGWLLRRKGKPAHGSSVNISKSSISGSVVAGRDNINQTVNISPSHDPTDDEYSETPTADEIMAQTNSLPFLQQEAARRSYKGIKVKWPARISYITELRTRPGIADVTLRYGDRSAGAVIYVEVELDKYPRLRSVHEGEAVTVMGTIAGMLLGDIRLDPKKLEWRKT
jgi:hypothetical protein